MELVTPGIGLIVWTSLAFLIAWFILGKFAWKPILKALGDRERSIEEALESAERAKREMAELKSKNDDLLKEARKERDEILKEARETRDMVIGEAKNKAKEEADKIVAGARETIRNEKMAAVTELKNQVAVLSIEIAERILQDELSDSTKQKSLVDNLMDDVKLN